MTTGPLGKGPPPAYDELKATRDARRATKAALRKPLKAVNKERIAKKAESEGFEPEYLDWLRTQPCIISGVLTRDWIPEERMFSGGRGRFAKVEAAHMRAGRTEGTDLTALPVETFFHKQQHRLGIRTWAEKHGLDLPALIAAHRKRYSLELAAKAADKTKFGAGR